MVESVVLARPKPASPSILPLVELVQEVIRASLQRTHPVLAEEEITMGQFWALHSISSLEAASLSTVARYLGLTTPTVCANIDGLEAAGLVRRARSERDRRSVELSLTPRGRKVEARVWQDIAHVMADAARDVSDADLVASVRVFREIAARLAAPSRPRRRDA
ncbi:MAG: MarR family winged helix-turn-helix transcriptional regulator [Thermoplasmata archaeon]